MTTKTFTVPNISCGHCTHTIQMEVGDLAGVDSVQADEATKQVTVQWGNPATWETDPGFAHGDRLSTRRVGGRFTDQ